METVVLYVTFWSPLVPFPLIALVGWSGERALFSACTAQPVSVV